MTTEALEAELRKGVLITAEWAAERLAAIGDEGHHVLVRVALDADAATGARIAATRNLSAAVHVPVLGRLLTDAVPALRWWALKRVGEAKLVELADMVAALVDDSATIHDLADVISIADAARDVLAILRAGR